MRVLVAPHFHKVFILNSSPRYSHVCFPVEKCYTFFFLPKMGNDAFARYTKFILWLRLLPVGGAQLCINQPDLSEALRSESWPSNFSPDCFIFTEQLSSSAWHNTCSVLAEWEGDLLLIFNSFCQDSIYLNNLILITASSICHLDYSLSPFKETDCNFFKIYTSITCKNSWDPVGSNQYLLTDWLAQCSLKSIFIFIW